MGQRYRCQLVWKCLLGRILDQFRSQQPPKLKLAIARSHVGASFPKFYGCIYMILKQSMSKISQSLESTQRKTPQPFNSCNGCFRVSEPGVVVIPWVKRSACAREGSKHCMPPQSKAPERSCHGRWLETTHGSIMCFRKSWRKTEAVWFGVYGNLGKEDTIWFEEWENENLLDSFWGSSANLPNSNYQTLLDSGIMIASNVRALRILYLPLIRFCLPFNIHQVYCPVLKAKTCFW